MGAGVLAYAAAVGLLVFNETSLVYASAGTTRSTRLVPAANTGIPWDTLRVRAADSVPVLLLESRVDDAADRPWAIYFHGNAGLLGSRGNVSRYQLLHDAGFNVLAVEYRGYGASVAAGPPTEGGVYADATAAWKHVTTDLGVAPGRVILYGWSLGSGPATYVAATHPAAALVTEGGFTSLPDVGAARYPWVPVRYVMRNQFNNLQRARTLAMPWIVFHGRADRDVPFSHGEALAAAARGARLVALAADHNDGVIADRALALGALRELGLRTRSLASSGTRIAIPAAARQ